MLGEAFMYLQRDDDWLRTVGIGGLLTLTSPLLLPLFPLQGFLLRVLRSSATGGRAPPSFSDWRSLSVDGAKLLAVQVGYVLVPLAIAGIGLAIAGYGTFGLGGSGTGRMVEIGGLAVLGSAGVLLGMAVFLMPAGMAHFAREREFRAAFDVVTVFRTAFTPGYVTAFVLAVVLSATVGTLALALTVVLVGPFLLFYLQVTVSYLFGRGYVTGRDLEGASAPPSPGPPV